MQTAGHLCRVVIEFAACVQHGHDDFGGGAALPRMSTGMPRPLSRTETEPE